MIQGGPNRERVMISKQEQQQLREIERGLIATDPRLVLLMAGGTYQQPARRPVRRGRALLLFVDLLALVMVVLAAATGLLMLIFASSLVSALAISLHVVRRRARLV